MSWTRAADVRTHDMSPSLMAGVEDILGGVLRSERGERGGVEECVSSPITKQLGQISGRAAARSCPLVSDQ